MLIRFMKLNIITNNMRIESKRGITVRKWRRLKGRPNGTQWGPLVDLPDWSYTDGRGFGPLTVGQKKRYIRDQELAQSVVKYMKQINTAIELSPEEHKL